MLLLSILTSVSTVTAQFQNVMVINPRFQQISPMTPNNIQKFVSVNLQSTLQDMNDIWATFTVHPPGQRIFVINHRPQNTQNLGRNNFGSVLRILQNNFGTSQHNTAALNQFPNMHVSIGTLIPWPHKSLNSINLHPPPAFIQSDIYNPPKTSTFVNYPLKNQPLIPPPDYTTKPSNTFSPENVTPAPVVNEENNNEINDDDQDYDIDVRHEPS